MNDKQMEKLIDACYDVMFQREGEMRELGLLNYGDSSYYIQNPDEYEKDRRIVKLENEVERLERRLSNCIEPKFKVGQEVWLVLCDGVKKDVVKNNYYLYSLEKSRLGLYESCLYATEEEAKAKLEKLKNG